LLRYTYIAYLIYICIQSLMIVLLAETCSSLATACYTINVVVTRVMCTTAVIDPSWDWL